jgi:hypothetical protein
MTTLEQIGYHQKAFVCIHVFERVRPVLLVSREDGDWCFLCGEEHPNDPSYYRVGGIGHLIEQDPELANILDLLPNQEAERGAPGESWIRTSNSLPW